MVDAAAEDWRTVLLLLVKSWWPRLCVVTLRVAGHKSKLTVVLLLPVLLIVLGRS